MEVQKALPKPKKHKLCGLMQLKRIPIYQLKYILGEQYPSETQLWMMLSGYKDMPEKLEKEIAKLLTG